MWSSARRRKKKCAILWAQNKWRNSLVLHARTNSALVLWFHSFISRASFRVNSSFTTNFSFIFFVSTKKKKLRKRKENCSLLIIVVAATTASAHLNFRIDYFFLMSHETTHLAATPMVIRQSFAFGEFLQMETYTNKKSSLDGICPLKIIKISLECHEWCRYRVFRI